MELSQVTFLAFAICSSLRVFSYFPQIVRIAADSNGATAISFWTWGLWTAANTSTGLYAAINLHDFYLTTVSAFYTACCLIVIALTTIKRRALRLSCDRGPIADTGHATMTPQLGALHCPTHLHRG
jgi:hypothetical protein